MWKKGYIYLGIFSILLSFMIVWKTDLAIASEEEDLPKDIYVVYDNSGSMLLSKKDSEYPWYETAYAMEMLTAMLEENDRLHIYFMQDQEEYFILEELSYTPGMKLQTLVDHVHERLQSVVYTLYTHSDGLMQAIDDMNHNERDSQLFLVILSDGVFNSRNGAEFASDGSDFNQLVAEANEALTTPATVISVMLPSAEKDARRRVFDEDREAKQHVYEVSNSKTEEYAIFNTFTEVSNLIFEKQALSYQKNASAGGVSTLQFATELPASRIIIVGQMKGSEENLSADDIQMNSDQILQTSSGVISGLDREKVECNTGKTGITLNRVSGGNYSGIVTMWKASKQDLIPAGTYSVEVPASMEVEIYVEYDVSYQLQLIDEESGETWDIMEGLPELMYTGRYRWQARLIDSMTGEELLPTGSSDKSTAYGNFSLNLEVQNAGTTEVWQSFDGEIELAEGDFSIAGTITWQGKNFQYIETGAEVKRRLGTLRIIGEAPAAGFDIDLLDTYSESIKVSIQEYDGTEWKTLSPENYEEIEVQVTGHSDFAYQCEWMETGGWEIYPVKSNPIIMDEDGQATDLVTVTVNGELESQPVSLSEEYTVTYQAFPQEITFALEGIDQTSYMDLRKNGIRITPLILGSPIIETDDTGIEQVECDFTLDADIDLNYKTKKTGTESVIYLLTFKCPLNILKFWNGGEIRGTVTASCLRYNQESNGMIHLAMQIQPISAWGKFGVCFILLCILYTVGMIVWKTVTKCRLYGIRLEAYYNLIIGKQEYNREKLPIKRCRVRNFFVPFNSQVVIPLEEIYSCGISELVIVRRMGGWMQIKNIGQLLAQENITNGGLKLSKDGIFRLDAGLQLDIKGEYTIQIVLMKRGWLNEY